MKTTETLCYEVWGNGEMIAAYWDVLDAWRVSQAVMKTSKMVCEVAVASGIEIWVPTGERRIRSDVIGTAPE